ncbi:hypothetical protein GOP47_0014797 [Adiantum capillus-veneris]|uniref:Uncharacterized protein n=1 Tax=Adiantum capillus-veneris TaxID=13818 RepID=A0A9D4UMS0_ADICA|nr:hypothetical protein GOP47_0014797 [Adiantum capillus-veneris]
MGVEALNNGVAEVASEAESAEKVRTALVALESAKDTYALELSELKALNDAIAEKLEHRVKDEPLCTSEMEPAQCFTLLENLLHEREVLVEDLRQEKARYEELEKELKREHTEKLEAQMCLSVLNDTIKKALQGEKFLVEQNRHLLSEQELLASKLEEVSTTRLSGLRSQVKGLESACSSVRQEEVALVLYNKVCARGLCVFVELVFFCHAMICVILRTLKENYAFAPT